MIKIKAYLRLYIEVRKTPIFNGYRPVFDFIPEMKAGGQINLLGKDEFAPGEEGEVEIIFISKESLGADFKVGKVFYFGEGRDTMGEGRVLKLFKDLE